MPRRHRGGAEVLLDCSFNLGARWGWVVSAKPRPLYPGKEPWYPFYRRLGGLRGRSGETHKISPTPGFEPRTVQAVASRNTDYAILAPTTTHAYPLSVWNTYLGLRIQVFRDVTQCRWLNGCRRFKRTSYLHLKGQSKTPSDTVLTSQNIWTFSNRAT